MRVVTFELGMRATPALAADQVRAAVSRGDGAILDAQRLSNKALAYRIEVSPAACPGLLCELAALGAVIAQRDHDYPTRDAAPDVTVQLHVTLVHDEPDQRIPLPKVPG